MADRLFLIDAMAYAFRSYYAIRGLSTASGQPTNAVYGFIRVLLKILREHEPSHIAVVFDAPGKTFREEIYPAYKANRAETPPELISQFPLIEQAVEAFNIRKARVDGVEADDVLGTLAKRAAAQGFDVVIVTGDKDALQLVQNGVRVFDPSKGDTGQWYGPDEVRERFGVGPERVIDALGLMGDSSDNVPGVRGIGEKTARKLLEEYGSIESIYAHLDEIKGKQRERLEQDRELALLSRELVTIKCDVDIDLSLESCRRMEPDPGRLREFLEGLEFHSLLEELVPGGPESRDDYRLVLTEKELARAIQEMRAAGAFAVDTETTSTDPMRAELVGISLSCKGGTGYYIPVGHAPEALDFTGERHGNLDKKTALDLLRPLLEDERLTKIGHNIKYDLIVLERAGVRVSGPLMDTMVASYLTDSSRLRHNLDDISLHYLKRKLIPISELIGKGPRAVTFDKVPVSLARDYACEDADMAWRLAAHFEPLLRERGLDRLYEEVERPLIRVLARMEMTGVAIDPEVFKALQGEINRRLRQLEEDIYDTAGERFQINSPKQLQVILFEKIGLKPLRKTKTGYSTDTESLEDLAREHPLPEKIIEFRTLDKLRGTYVEALPKLIHPETGRIHTSFNQAVAATGRLSSSDPNLQNIPVRTEMGRRIREGFVPGEKGYQLISADYSQIELRILAHLSGDEAMVAAFRANADIHRDTAARVFGVPPADVTPEMRRQAKAVNFGVVYGISAFGLARNLGISAAEAQRFIDQYFAQYPGVRAWLDATIEAAKRDGYVTTMLNRRRYLAELAGGSMGSRRAAERVAVNTPVQGSAADIIKLAMVRLDKALEGSAARMLLQVHDELLVEAPQAEAPAVAKTMAEIMENVVTLSVPLKVDARLGANWAEIH